MVCNFCYTEWEPEVCYGGYGDCKGDYYQWVPRYVICPQCGNKIREGSGVDED